MSKQQLNQREGELYAGIVLGKDGQGDHHLFLLAAKTPPLTWGKAIAWAESVGGSLPTRQEQSILYGNLGSEFDALRYWSCETHGYLSEYAWMMSFAYGYQDSSRKSKDYSARAVRRVPIV